MMYALSNHDLFCEKVEKETFRPYIRCEICIHANFNNPSAPEGYIHCNKYNMYSLKDMTCKSGEKKND